MGVLTQRKNFTMAEKENFYDFDKRSATYIEFIWLLCRNDHLLGFCLLILEKELFS